LLVGLLAVVLGAGPGIVPAAEEPLEGMMPIETGDGATLILTGYLSREKFELKEIRIVGSRLASRSSDPDQFRATLLDVEGRMIGAVKMWSPLLTFVWDLEGLHESAESSDHRVVDIQVPATIAIDRVILSWPQGMNEEMNEGKYDGKYEVASLSVAEEIGQFCKLSPRNPACSARVDEKGTEQRLSLIK
jgi:hypothetical protein